MERSSTATATSLRRRGALICTERTDFPYPGVLPTFPPCCGEKRACSFCSTENWAYAPIVKFAVRLLDDAVLYDMTRAISSSR
jgi:hypothetical protein